MKSTHQFAIVVGIACLLAATSGLAQNKRRSTGPESRPEQRPSAQSERLQERMQSRQKTERARREQQRTKNFSHMRQGDIYGGEMMTKRERSEYRKRLEGAESSPSRERIENRHRQMIESRAAERGVRPVPPGLGIYRGSQMTAEERNRYREQLSALESEDERAQYLARHRERMQERTQKSPQPMNQDQDND